MWKTGPFIVLISSVALAVPAGAAVPSRDHAAAVSSPRGQHTKCKNDGHKYILGKTATAHAKKTTFVGTFARFHPCGLDDGYFTTGKGITLTLTSKTTIKVFHNQDNPSNTKTVTAAAFPHWFKKNRYEPTYQYSGPRSGVTTLSEHFTS